MYQEVVYDGTPVEAYYNGKLTFTGVIPPGKDKVGTMRIMRDLVGHTKAKWELLWTSIHTEANGQVKNYLVAVRTLVQAPRGEQLKILLNGSKNSASSGLWHGFFLDMVERRNPGSEVTFCDYNEVPQPNYRPLIKVEYKKNSIEKGAYDMLIDDVHDGDSVQSRKLKSKYYSHKGEGKFFLIFEKRKFSHEIEEVSTPCPCLVCKVIGQVSESYEEYQLLKDQIVMLGHVTCESHSQRENYIRSELKAVANQVYDIVRGIPHVADTPIKDRVLPAVAKIVGGVAVAGEIKLHSLIDESKLMRGWQAQYGYEVSNPTCSHQDQCECKVYLIRQDQRWEVSGKDKEEKLNSIMKVQPSIMESDCVLVRGKSVEFLGVTPDFFFPTILGKGPPQVSVVGRGAKIGHASPYVFSLENMQGYQKMPYQWKGYNLYVRKTEKERRVEIYGMPPVLTKFQVELRVRKKKVNPVVQYSLKRFSQGWELLEVQDDSIVVSVDKEGDYSLSRERRPLPTKFRMAFYGDLMSNMMEDPSNERSVNRWQLLMELKHYFSQGMVKGFYGRVMKELPPEIVYLIDKYFVT